MSADTTPPEQAGDVETGIGETRTAYDLDRTIGFSDGVIAIAITLMVLDLKVPQIERPTPEALFDALWAQRTQIFVYALSFVVVARYWLGHHRLFGQLHTVNTKLIALNLLFLALIGLVPFPTDVLGRFASEPIAITLYAVEMALVTGVLALLYQYAVTRGLTEPGILRPNARRALAAPLVFLAAIPVAFFVSTAVAPFVWFGLALIGDDEGWIRKDA